MAFRVPLNRIGIDGYLLALAATVCLAIFMPATGDWAKAIDKAAVAAIALLFCLYGARLSSRAIIAGITHWRLQVLILVSTFIIFPCIGLICVWIVGPFLEPKLVLGLLFLSALPSTVQSSIALTAVARGNVSAGICAASLSSMLGVFVTPLLASLLLTSADAHFSYNAIFNIVLLLLAPFAVGHLLRPKIGRTLARYSFVTSIVDRGSIVLVVYAAFSKGMIAGTWSRVAPLDLVLVIAADLIILVTMLGLMIFLSRYLKFAREDEVSIAFCGSQKSMAAGIPIAGILFSPSVTALIVLPLMLFHQLQLFICAVLARRYAQRSNEQGYIGDRS